MSRHKTITISKELLDHIFLWNYYKRLLAAVAVDLGTHDKLKELKKVHVKIINLKNIHDMRMTIIKVLS